MKSSRKNQTLLVKYAGLVAIVIWISACSSSQTKESDNVTDNIDDIPVASDAGTDALPQTAAEVPPAPTPDVSNDPAPPLDQAASPAILPSTNATEATQTEDYSVKRGDTLMKVSFEIYGDIYRWKEIYEKNKDKISNPNAIPSGLVLKIDRPVTAFSPDHNGEKYLIKEGDTLGKISDSLYGTPAKWKALWENNKSLIQNPNRIFAGFYLYYLPDGARPVVGSQESSAAPVPPASPSAASPALGDASAAAQSQAAASSAPADTGTPPEQAAAGADVAHEAVPAGAEPPPAPPAPGF
jgi:LysM repeat protein